MIKTVYGYKVTYIYYFGSSFIKINFVLLLFVSLFSSLGDDSCQRLVFTQPLDLILKELLDGGPSRTFNLTLTVSIFLELSHIIFDNRVDGLFLHIRDHRSITLLSRMILQAGSWKIFYVPFYVVF